MRLRKRRRDVTASIQAAARAYDETAARLAETRDIIAVQRERGRSERETIIASLKRMRQANNLAEMLLDTVEREANGATGSPAHQ